jgi:hypothetical protein
MLVVTTSMGMVDGVHGYTTSLGPAVALGGELKHNVSIFLILRIVFVIPCA